MALIVKEYTEGVRPVSVIEKAKVNLITLAGRAANWTPWVKKSDESDSTNKGDGNMAGEYIQAFLVPADGGFDEIKAIFGDEIATLLTTEKVEKSEFEGLTKYSLISEDRFEKLDAGTLGDSKAKAIFGPLKSETDANKFDVDSIPLVPMPSYEDMWGRTFSDIVRNKGHALTDAIVSNVSLKGDWPAVETAIRSAIDDYSGLVFEAVAVLREKIDGGVGVGGNVGSMGADMVGKSDTGNATSTITPTPSPTPSQTDNKLWTRVRTAFLGGSRAHKSDKTEDNTMEFTKEQLDALLAETAEKAADKGAIKALEALKTDQRSEEAKKADADAAEKEAAEKADTKAKIDAAIAWIEEQKEKAVKADAETAAASGDEDARKAELDAMKTELDVMKVKSEELATKMDSLRRAYKPSGDADTTQVATPQKLGDAEKSDLSGALNDAEFFARR